MHNPPSQDEIKQFQQLKSHQITTKLDLKWKDSIKEQIEDEINRKVREALDTPPHDKNNKALEAPDFKREYIENQKDLNSHLNFNDRERNKYTTRLSTSIIERSFNQQKNSDYNNPEDNQKDYNDIDFSNKFEYWLKPKFEPQQFNCSGILQKIDNSTNNGSEEKKLFRTGFDAMQNFGSLTLREKELLFSTFTKDGFNEAIRTGRFQDGSKLEALANGIYRDKYEIYRDKHGPFWPKEKGPLHPTPLHKRILLGIEEPLIDPQTEKDINNEKSNANCQFSGIWRHNQIVFDSEYSPRNQRPHSRGENMCPDLVFESRFESGNLRQARRTAQVEYELVLQNDIFTTRHTQWFYFRIQNMIKDVTYKFIIINLLKPTSLYMNGMRMLMYSDKSASIKKCGWFRTGHHIRYSRNITKLQCPLLNREISYYQLDFQLEFPYSEDSCYLAHCYPYTYTDLKNDLEIHLKFSNQSNNALKKDVLCETRLGNSCFVLTITDTRIPDKDKLGAIITARVHPGETNSSWMMNGLIHFLTSEADEAQQIRKRMVFKIIPMLNPDGVIIGNYRCSTVGRDLNRNYRFPREHSFPTIFHTKKLVESLKDTCQEVAIYCDLHGHSRKHNVFMYGCDSQYLDCSDVNNIRPTLTKDTVETYVKDRIFPWLMQRQRPNMFSFSECQFKIRKCKESTGRVVMWKEFNVSDSYTLETTFSGSNFDNSSRLHFNTYDLESIGRTLSEVLLSYTEIIGDERLCCEIRLEVLKTILKQFAHKNKKMNKIMRSLATAKSSEQGEYSRKKEDLDNNNDNMTEADFDNNLLDAFISNFQINDLDKFRELNIIISDYEDDSSSSDSDSESQPEEPVETEDKQTKNRRKRRKFKIQIRDKSENLKKNSSSKRKPLPLIKSENISSKEKAICEKSIKSNLHSISKTYPMRPSLLFISKFDGRSNGGIPCFAEERLEERARRRSFASLKKDIEDYHFKKAFPYNNDVFNLKSEPKPLGFKLSSEDLMKQYRLLYKRSSDILQYRHSTSSYDNVYVGEKSSQEIKEDLGKNIQKPIISQKHVNEITDSNARHYSVYQTGDGVIFKSLSSEGPMIFNKQVNVLPTRNKNEE